MENFETLYKNEFSEFLIDNNSNILLVRRLGYLTDKKIKDSLERTLLEIKERKCTKIMSDMQEIKGTWTSTNDWIAKDWFPRALAEGMQFIAYVYSPDIFAKFALNDLVKKLQNGTMQIFKDFDEAYNWINNQ